MSNKKLQESEYEGYFNSLSKGMKDEAAEIEVMAVSIMDRELTDWIPFFGISYDPSEKTISIISEFIDHHIKNPTEITVQEGDKGVESIEINGGDGYTHRIKFKNPIAL
jgi:hypothetical protein